MAQKLLRIITMGEPDRFIPDNQTNIDSTMERINFSKEKIKIELVESDNDGVTFKTITTIAASEQFEKEQRDKTVIANQQDEIAELRRQNLELKRLQQEQPERLKPGPKPKTKEEVEA